LLLFSDCGNCRRRKQKRKNAQSLAGGTRYAALHKQMWLFLKLYLIMVWPGLLLLGTIYWILRKSRLGRAKKIAIFSTAAVAILAPFFMQVDIMLIIGPAYVAIPMLIDGGQKHLVGVLLGELPFHLIGLFVVGLMAYFVSSGFLFRPAYLAGQPP